jgi:hypothetical protein
MEGKIDFSALTNGMEVKKDFIHPTPMREIGKAMLIKRFLLRFIFLKMGHTA